MKELVYWGIGEIGQKCLAYCSEQKPHLIIDSYSQQLEARGIRVVHPDSIVNWEELFVVITLVNWDSVASFLKEKGLEENKDFVHYTNYFHITHISDYNAVKSLQYMNNQVEHNPKQVGKTLLFIPLFCARNEEVLSKFVRQYAQREPSILLMDYWLLGADMISDMLGYPAYRLAQMASLDLGEDRRCCDDHIDITTASDEEGYIREVIERKGIDANGQTTYLAMQTYQYLEQVIDLLAPKQIIIWGGWGFQSYFLEHICQKMSIPYAFMEYGWLPGTYQFDPRGIAGQSEYANKNNPKGTYDREQIARIKQYIVDKKLDTSVFTPSLEEESRLLSIPTSRKTIFLVGMDDCGMAINPRTIYWSTYVSSCVNSTQEAYQKLTEICKKRGWNFVFKPHPDAHNRNNIKFEEQSNYHFEKMQIDRLIERADVVVSISSTVGYKVLLYAKPLVQIGVTSMSGKGCCYEVHTKDEMENMLFEAIEAGMTKEQEEQFDRHLDFILREHLWDDLSDKEIPYGLTLQKPICFRKYN